MTSTSKDSKNENKAIACKCALIRKYNMGKSLQNLLLEKLKIQAKYDAYTFSLEEANEAEKSENYDKRAEIIKKLMKPANTDGDGPKQKVIYFWLTVFKATELCCHIKQHDIPILQHLYDIRTKIYADVPGRHFVLEFYFEPNKYFSNTVLRKTYYFRDLQDMLQPLEYDGFKIDHCEGCRIYWYSEEYERFKEKCANSWSFFDFFNPPKIQIPVTDDICTIEDLQAKKYKLKQDFLIGCYFKEQLLPKAMYFFYKGLKKHSGHRHHKNNDNNHNENHNNRKPIQEQIRKEVEIVKEKVNENSNDYYEVVIKDGQAFCVGSGDNKHDETHDPALRK